MVLVSGTRTKLFGQMKNTPYEVLRKFDFRENGLKNVENVPSKMTKWLQKHPKLHPKSMLSITP